ncbi:MAG: DUF4783 domain-containing protein [Bacteroidales bacterium]
MFKKFFFRLFLIISILLPTKVFSQDAQDKIIKALREGSAKELARYFNPALTFAIPGHDGIFSQSQAEGYLKRFFEDNKPVNFRINHQGKSADGAHFFIGVLTCNTGFYKVYALMKMMEGRERIIQFQIESNEE